MTEAHKAKAKMKPKAKNRATKGDSMEEMLAAEQERAKAMLAMFAAPTNGSLSKPPEMFGSKPPEMFSSKPPEMFSGRSPEMFSSPLVNPTHEESVFPPATQVASSSKTRTLRGPPVQEFEVVHAEVTLRAAPTVQSKTCGFKRRGEKFKALEETFDGWVRLVNGEGWILRNDLNQQAVAAIEPLGEVWRLAAPGFADESGRQMFEVVSKPSAQTFAEPAHDSEVLSSKSYGEIVLADSQTYNGWVRLSDGQGWMPSMSSDYADILHCLFWEEQIARREEEKAAAERAIAEAAIERSIERDRQSQWWRKLEQPNKQAPIEKVGRSSIDLPEVKTGKGVCNPLGLPTLEFEVTEDVPIRREPGTEAPVCGVKRLGDCVRATEETFDGWVKLADEPGWILKDTQFLGGPTASLVPTGEPEAIASPSLSRMPGRQMFEVVIEGGLQIFREPAEGALVLGFRTFGEFVLADTQSYHGWVRLSDDEGWMLGSSADDGCMLLNVRPDELQLVTSGHSATVASSPEIQETIAAEAAAAQKDAARREALRQLEVAALGANTASFCAALAVARDKGVSKRDIARCNALRTNG